MSTPLFKRGTLLNCKHWSAQQEEIGWPQNHQMNELRSTNVQPSLTALLVLMLLKTTIPHALLRFIHLVLVRHCKSRCHHSVVIKSFSRGQMASFAPSPAHSILLHLCCAVQHQWHYILDIYWYSFLIKIIFRLLFGNIKVGHPDTQQH